MYYFSIIPCKWKTGGHFLFPKQACGYLSVLKTLLCVRLATNTPNLVSPRAREWQACAVLAVTQLALIYACVGNLPGVTNLLMRTTCAHLHHVTHMQKFYWINGFLKSMWSRNKTTQQCVIIALMRTLSFVDSQLKTLQNKHKYENTPLPAFASSIPAPSFVLISKCV